MDTLKASPRAEDETQSSINMQDIDFERILHQTSKCTSYEYGLTEFGFGKACRDLGISQSWEKFDAWSTQEHFSMISNPKVEWFSFNEEEFQKYQQPLGPEDRPINYVRFQAYLYWRIIYVLDEAEMNDNYEDTFERLCREFHIDKDRLMTWEMIFSKVMNEPQWLQLISATPQTKPKTDRAAWKQRIASNIDETCYNRVTGFEFCGPLYDTDSCLHFIGAGITLRYRYYFRPMPQAKYKEDDEYPDWLGKRRCSYGIHDHNRWYFNRCFFVLSPVHDCQRDSFIGMQVGSLERYPRTCEEPGPGFSFRQWLNIPVVLKIDPGTLLSQGLYILNPRKIENSFEIPFFGAEALEDLGLGACSWGLLADKAKTLKGGETLEIPEATKRYVGSERFTVNPGYLFDGSIKSKKGNQQE